MVGKMSVFLSVSRFWITW